MHDTDRRPDRIDQPTITDHAVLRFLQRADANEPHPRERLAVLWRRGRPATPHGVYGDARRVGDLVLVARGGHLTTVLSLPDDTRSREVPA